jgi:hypothetical protein
MRPKDVANELRQIVVSHVVFDCHLLTVLSAEDWA